MDSSSSTSCPVCRLTVQPLAETPDKRPGRRDNSYYDCPRCGRYGLTRQAMVNLRSLLAEDLRRQVAFSHALRKMQAFEEWPLVTAQVCERIVQTASLPTVEEQADNLVRWLGDNLHDVGPGEFRKLEVLRHGAIVGALSTRGFDFITNGLASSGLILESPAMDASYTLTFPGWHRYQELLRGSASGRKAFMAMPYGDPTLDGIVNDHFRPAVKQTGFILQRLDDDPKAGLIDDRMRVEIQSARFLIADLTHRNNGAYWEAGYAEGLGKPVIYTCEESAFKDRPSHFDTNHHLHVLWRAEELDRAMRNLKDTIRATIPDAVRELD